jgi:hypothetical protein
VRTGQQEEQLSITQDERRKIMADLIPGYDYIGRGFDVFGPFDIRSLAQKERLFSTNIPSDQTYKRGDTVYTVPQNTAVLEVGTQGGQTVFFNQKSDVSQFFSAQAGIEGSYQAFSGAFDAAFGSIARSTSEYQFGMFYLMTEGFAVEVIEATPDQLLPAVKADPDFMNLPMQYTPDNKYLFFRFFDKYGTHFVRSVTLGGRLLYNVAIDKSSQFSQQDFETKLTAEYKATFGSAAYAQVEWQSVGETWATKRMVTIDVVGGDTSILNSLRQSEPPDNFEQAFESWIASLPTAYGATNFSLSGIDRLFSGAQADAVKQAMDDYTQQHIFLRAQDGPDLNTTSGSIILSNSALSLVNSYAGLGVAIIDRQNLKPLFMKGYSIGSQSVGKNFDYTQVLQDLAVYKGKSSIIVALLWWGTVADYAYPSLDLRNFLYSCGAGDGLDRWGDAAILSLNSRPLGVRFTYAIVGIPGWSHNQAIEGYAEKHIPPIPDLELQVFLKPEDVNQQLLYTPS